MLRMLHTPISVNNSTHLDGIQEMQRAYANLYNLWRRTAVRLSKKGTVCYATTRAVLLYDYLEQRIFRGYGCPITVVSRVSVRFAENVGLATLTLNEKFQNLKICPFY